MGVQQAIYPHSANFLAGLLGTKQVAVLSPLTLASMPMQSLIQLAIIRHLTFWRIAPSKK